MSPQYSGENIHYLLLYNGLKQKGTRWIAYPYTGYDPGHCLCIISRVSMRGTHSAMSFYQFCPSVCLFDADFLFRRMHKSSQFWTLCGGHRPSFLSPHRRRYKIPRAIRVSMGALNTRGGKMFAIFDRNRRLSLVSGYWSISLGSHRHRSISGDQRFR